MLLVFGRNLLYPFLVLNFKWFIHFRYITRGVPFILSSSTAALLPRKPATAGTPRDRTRAQGHDTRDYYVTTFHRAGKNVNSIILNEV